MWRQKIKQRQKAFEKPVKTVKIQAISSRRLRELKAYEKSVTGKHTGRELLGPSAETWQKKRTKKKAAKKLTKAEKRKVGKILKRDFTPAVVDGITRNVHRRVTFKRLLKIIHDHDRQYHAFIRMMRKEIEAARSS